MELIHPNYQLKRQKIGESIKILSSKQSTLKQKNKGKYYNLDKSMYNKRICENSTILPQKQNKLGWKNQRMYPMFIIFRLEQNVDS